VAIFYLALEFFYFGFQLSPRSVFLHMLDDGKSIPILLHHTVFEVTKLGCRNGAASWAK
jgi:hypothetical protein